jgi:hypothetical protein
MVDQDDIISHLDLNLDSSIDLDEIDEQDLIDQLEITITQEEIKQNLDQEIDLDEVGDLLDTDQQPRITDQYKSVRASGLSVDSIGDDG